MGALLATRNDVYCALRARGQLCKGIEKTKSRATMKRTRSSVCSHPWKCTLEVAALRRDSTVVLHTSCAISPLGRAVTDVCNSFASKEHRYWMSFFNSVMCNETPVRHVLVCRNGYVLNKPTVIHWREGAWTNLPFDAFYLQVWRNGPEITYYTDAALAPFKDCPYCLMEYLDECCCRNRPWDWETVSPHYHDKLIVHLEAFLYKYNVVIWLLGESRSFHRLMFHMSNIVYLFIHTGHRHLLPTWFVTQCMSAEQRDRWLSI